MVLHSPWEQKVLRANLQRLGKGKIWKGKSLSGKKDKSILAHLSLLLEKYNCLPPALQPHLSVFISFMDNSRKRAHLNPYHPIEKDSLTHFILHLLHIYSKPVIDLAQCMRRWWKHNFQPQGVIQMEVWKEEKSILVYHNSTHAFEVVWTYIHKSDKYHHGRQRKKISWRSNLRAGSWNVNNVKSKQSQTLVKVVKQILFCKYWQ